MKTLHGVYAYPIPETITKGIDGCILDAISEDPKVYCSYANKDDINLLVIRQGIVNDLLNYYPNVRWLHLLNAGYEKVNLELLRQRGILFTNARSVYCGTIAEDVIAKILFLARNYMHHFRDQAQHFWPNDEQLPNSNLDLNGRVLGILGAGAIGHEIATRARIFGLVVRGYDPYISQRDGFEVIYQGESGLKQLMHESDFVITSLPVTPETTDIINDVTLGYMKPSAYLINVARGAIVDEYALVHALNCRQIAGAALDVTKTEPLPADSPLWTAENLLLTPHRAAYGDQMTSKMCALIERNIRHYLSDEPLEDRIL